MERNLSNIKERVLYIAENKGVSFELFFSQIGMTYGSFKGKQKKTSLNSDAIDRIITNFPDIDAGWLITGKGTMRKEDTGIQLHNKNQKTIDKLLPSQEIPLFDFQATAGLQELLDSSKPHDVLDTIRIPNLPPCDGAITITGDSMYPLLKSGDIILFKQVPVELPNIYFGEMYLLGVSHEYDEYVTVKYIQRSEMGDEWVKLVSQNKNHQPKDIPLNTINGLAMIKASVRFNTMF